MVTWEIILRYLHFISIFTIVSTLVAEHLLLKNALRRSDVGRLARIDAVYGLAAISLLAAGLTLWLGSFGKPSQFYTGNWIFHVKLTLFICVGLLSIYPTIFFIKNRKGNPDEVVTIPKILIWLVRFELLLLLVIPFLAGLMAKGVGYSVI